MNIENFKIYGERNSGTNLLQAVCAGSSFYHNEEKPALDIPQSEEYGWKHWFGFNSEDIQKKGQNTLFLGIVRDPYAWMTGLFQKKHHIPAINYSVENFLLGEWYSIDHKKNSPTYRQEVLGDRNWKTGERYKNIFELRKNKLEYLVNHMPQLAKHYRLIRYEDFCIHHKQIMNEIGQKFDVKINDYSIGVFKKKDYREITPFVLDIINNHIDWDMEQQVGYSKRS